MSFFEFIGLFVSTTWKMLPVTMASLFDRLVCGKPLAKHTDDNMCYRYLIYKRRFGSRGRQRVFFLGERKMTAHGQDIVHSQYKGGYGGHYTPMFRKTVEEELSHDDHIGYGRDASYIEDPFWKSISFIGLTSLLSVVFVLVLIIFFIVRFFSL